MPSQSPTTTPTQPSFAQHVAAVINPRIQRLLFAAALSTVSLSASGQAQAKTVTSKRLAVQTVTTPGGAVRARIRVGKQHTGSQKSKTRIVLRVRDAHRRIGLLIAFSGKASTNVHVRLTPAARRVLRTKGRLRVTVQGEVGGAVVGNVRVTLTRRCTRR